MDNLSQKRLCSATLVIAVLCLTDMPKSHTHTSSQQQAAELNTRSEHEFRVAEHSDDQEHLKGPEHTRLEAEHHRNPEPAGGHGMHNFGHREIAALAYEFWQARGCPEGSADEDWANAVKELRSRNVRAQSATAKS
jgi:hypothetical protein